MAIFYIVKEIFEYSIYNNFNVCFFIKTYNLLTCRFRNSTPKESFYLAGAIGNRKDAYCGGGVYDDDNEGTKLKNKISNINSTKFHFIYNIILDTNIYNMIRDVL